MNTVAPLEGGENVEVLVNARPNPGYNKIQEEKECDNRKHDIGTTSGHGGNLSEVLDYPHKLNETESRPDDLEGKVGFIKGWCVPVLECEMSVLLKRVRVVSSHCSD